MTLQSWCKERIIQIILIYMICQGDTVNFSKMSTAYLYNILLYFLSKKKIFLEQKLIWQLRKKVIHTEGEKFTEINITKDILKSSQQCYIFNEETAAGNAVQILVDFIAEKNLVLENAKEFLNTTIGEIFSNAFIHSDKNEVFFMYDIEWDRDDILLVINVTDFGKTIIGNVRNYMKTKSEIELGDKECMEWAMKSGNTTRTGSGGYGLPTLVDYINKINGRLLIFSGGSVYRSPGTTEHVFETEGYFIGTSVSMKIALFDTSKAISYDEKNNQLISIGLDQI